MCCHFFPLSHLVFQRSGHDVRISPLSDIPECLAALYTFAPLFRFRSVTYKQTKHRNVFYSAGDRAAGRNLFHLAHTPVSSMANLEHKYRWMMFLKHTEEVGINDVFTYELESNSQSQQIINSPACENNKQSRKRVGPSGCFVILFFGIFRHGLNSRTESGLLFFLLISSNSPVWRTRKSMSAGELFLILEHVLNRTAVQSEVWI